MLFRFHQLVERSARKTVLTYNITNQIAVFRQEILKTIHRRSR